MENTSNSVFNTCCICKNEYIEYSTKDYCIEKVYVNNQLGMCNECFEKLKNLINK